MKDVYLVKQMCKATDDLALESGICSKLHGAVDICYDYYDYTRTAARFNLDDAFDQYGLRKWTWHVCIEMMSPTNANTRANVNLSSTWVPNTNLLSKE